VLPSIGMPVESHRHLLAGKPLKREHELALERGLQVIDIYWLGSR